MDTPSLAINKNGLEVLGNLLGFGAREIVDAIFVAIVFKGHSNIEEAYQPSRNSEFGVACLDTRDLLPGETHEEKESSHLISTQEFVTGTNKRWVEAIKTFRFGVAERISIYDMAEKVRQCLQTQDPETSKTRKVFIVKHWRNEMRSVDALRVRRYGGINSPLGIYGALDVARIANALLQRPPRAKPVGLEKLSSDLSIPFEYTDSRSAGNDANCTL